MAAWFRTDEALVAFEREMEPRMARAVAPDFPELHGYCPHCDREDCPNRTWFDSTCENPRPSARERLIRERARRSHQVDPTPDPDWGGDAMAELLDLIPEEYRGAVEDMLDAWDDDEDYATRMRDETGAGEAWDVDAA